LAQFANSSGSGDQRADRKCACTDYLIEKSWKIPGRSGFGLRCPVQIQHPFLFDPETST